MNKQGKTIDFLLIAKRDKAAALRFFDKAMKATGARGETPILIRQVKYLNNIVEQDHPAIKRVTKPILNFKSFPAARCVLAGIELTHMIRKGQFKIKYGSAMPLLTSFMRWQGRSVQFEKSAWGPWRLAHF